MAGGHLGQGSGESGEGRGRFQVVMCFRTNALKLFLPLQIYPAFWFHAFLKSAVYSLYIV